ncbi:DinB family protein [Acinetobacter bereziniae]|uniref:DinB family protein n=1 Tax=Acinetobacter bereziniae TaxID=106648 RepID=UPI00300BB4CB
MNKDNLRRFAQYNIWATQHLCECLKAVSDADFNQDIGLYFKSIAGTLNHLLLGEHYLWYSRFKENHSPTMALNTVIHQDKTQLLNELSHKSLNWLSFIDDLDETLLTGNLNYFSSNGEAQSLPYADTLIHVFNHGTHHRGQVTAAMTILGYQCPELDWVYMLVEENLQD